MRNLVDFIWSIGHCIVREIINNYAIRLIVSLASIANAVVVIGTADSVLANRLGFDFLLKRR